MYTWGEPGKKQQKNKAHSLQRTEMQNMQKASIKYLQIQLNREFQRLYTTPNPNSFYIEGLLNTCKLANLIQHTNKTKDKFTR